MAFGPSTPEQDIVLDIEAGVVLTTEMIRQASPTSIRVTLFTAALFSSGWLVNPFFAVVPSFLSDRTVDQMKAKSCGGSFGARRLST